MKKLLFIIAGIATIALYSFRNRDGERFKPGIKAKAQNPTPCDSCTLDGIPYHRADSMVRSFINNGNEPKYDSSLHTCVWYSADKFKAMIAAAGNGTDGVRFYFAKNNNQYTALAVATALAGSGDGKERYHQDYFLQTMPNISTNETTVMALPTDNNPGRGARLYDTTEPTLNTSVEGCSSTSPHYITSSKAYRLVYRNCGTGAKNGKFNATCEWFDLCFLKQMADSIPKGGGIRLYYAKNSGAIFGQGRLFPKGRHGFVIMLTEPDPTGKFQQDKFVCIPKPDCQPIIANIRQAFSFVNKAMIPLAAFANDTGDGATDNGEECPTNCIGVTWTDPTLN